MTSRIDKHLAVADAPELLQLLQDVVLGRVLGRRVEGELLQVVRDAARERYLVPAKYICVKYFPEDHSNSKNIFRTGEKYWFRHLEPESMATPTVQNCPNLFSEATLIPLSRTVILESSVCLLEDT